MQFMLVMVFQYALSILGMIVVCWFSRQREFRADAGGARLAGRDNMIGALRSLEHLYNPELATAEAQRAQSFQAFKISGKSSMGALFATHPPMEERIARLEQLNVS
jgi:heat shock protein HtpX